jgi:hypothetical protein
VQARRRRADVLDADELHRVAPGWGLDGRA